MFRPGGEPEDANRVDEAIREQRRVGVDRDTRGYEPKRRRKLLLKRAEIERLLGKTAERGLTLIPMRVYFTHGLAKVELGLGRGKRSYEKRP